MKVLGLAGKAGVGKDFTMHYLSEISRFPVVRQAFADGVRDEVTEYFYPEDGLGAVDFYTKPYDEVVRHLLQWWGTDYRRAQDEDYWVKRGMRVAKAYHEYWLEKGLAGVPMIVFTDVRFANEAEAISRAGGRVLEVQAPDRVRAARLGKSMEELAKQSKHPSEVIDFPTDGVVHNESDDAAPLFPGFLHEWLGLV